MPAVKYREYDEAAIKLRSQGMACRDVADELGIPTHAVWNIMRRAGKTGAYRAPQRRRKASGERRERDSAIGIVQRHGEVTLEAGLTGGVIAWIDDISSGECDNVASAIYAAERHVREATA